MPLPFVETTTATKGSMMMEGQSTLDGCTKESKGRRNVTGTRAGAGQMSIAMGAKQSYGASHGHKFVPEMREIKQMISLVFLFAHELAFCFFPSLELAFAFSSLELAFAFSP
jgi:hypothetical protein